jgi:hypothetical protein
MQPAVSRDYVKLEDYLAGESASEVAKAQMVLEFLSRVPISNQ